MKSGIWEVEASDRRSRGSAGSVGGARLRTSQDVCFSFREFRKVLLEYTLLSEAESTDALHHRRWLGCTELGQQKNHTASQSGSHSRDRPASEERLKCSFLSHGSLMTALLKSRREPRHRSDDKWSALQHTRELCERREKKSIDGMDSRGGAIFRK